MEEKSIADILALVKVKLNVAVPLHHGNLLISLHRKKDRYDLLFNLSGMSFDIERSVREALENEYFAYREKIKERGDWRTKRTYSSFGRAFLWFPVDALELQDWFFRVMVMLTDKQNLIAIPPLPPILASAPQPSDDNLKPIE